MKIINTIKTFPARIVASILNAISASLANTAVELRNPPTPARERSWKDVTDIFGAVVALLLWMLS